MGDEANRYADRFVGHRRLEKPRRRARASEAIAFACTTDPDGLVDRLAASQPHLIAMDANGSHEAIVAAALVDADLPVAIVDPRQDGKFAGAIGKLAKTDVLDAGVISHFADTIRPLPPGAANSSS
jgi:transposase